jgi:hypothetical protein
VTCAWRESWSQGYDGMFLMVDDFTNCFQVITEKIERWYGITENNEYEIA